MTTPANRVPSFLAYLKDECGDSVSLLKIVNKSIETHILQGMVLFFVVGSVWLMMMVLFS